MNDRLSKLRSEPRHVVVICGGAVSGSEAAAYCAGRGITAVVLEQNPRAYGKIEDGLPRWHDKLRAKEYERIDQNLDHPDVYFVPQTKLGVDLPFEEVARGWGASAVLLANGAWRDRPLPVPDVERFVDKGLVYQNPLVYWFNHYEDPDYAGQRYEIADDAIVVGGGLASVDVVKIINLELYRSALRARGISVTVVDMEHKGIPATLAQHGLTKDALDVRGCTLYYRRRVRDMPLAFPKANASPDQIEKTALVREKMVRILEDKFLVRVQACSAPIAAVIEGDRMVGVTFRRTEMKDGKLVELPGSEYDARSQLIVSSIGSVPEPVSGVPLKGELYDFTSWETGALRGLPGVFGLGNVLTGKGNIRESRENAEEIADVLIHDYLGIAEPAHTDGAAAATVQRAHDAARERAQPAIESAIRLAKVPVERLSQLARSIEARWRAVGYDGSYGAWMAQRRPLS